jgi:type II secretion system protein G
MTVKRSFTLIELLIVIAIIAVLAALLMPAMMGTRTEVKKTTTKMLIKKIELACMEYKNDWGVYPTEENDGSTGNLAAVLINYTGALPGGSRGPYLDRETSDYLESTDKITDLWQNELWYDNQTTGIWDGAADRNTTTFDIWSNGPDGVEDNPVGNVDDIGNWKY